MGSGGVNWIWWRASPQRTKYTGPQYAPKPIRRRMPSLLLGRHPRCIHIHMDTMAGTEELN
eukprot:6183692-Pleurochrysis_carterae.AAC.1